MRRRERGEVREVVHDSVSYDRVMHNSHNSQPASLLKSGDGVMMKGETQREWERFSGGNKNRQPPAASNHYEVIWRKQRKKPCISTPS
jgi:alkylated DNA repair dioxygenase AlkB